MSESSYPQYGVPYVKCARCGCMRPPTTAGECEDRTLCTRLLEDRMRMKLPPETDKAEG